MATRPLRAYASTVRRARVYNTPSSFFSNCRSGEKQASEGEGGSSLPNFHQVTGGRGERELSWNLHSANAEEEGGGWKKKSKKVFFFVERVCVYICPSRKVAGAKGFLFFPFFPGN